MKPLKIHIVCILLLILLLPHSWLANAQTSEENKEKPISFEMCFAKTTLFGNTFHGMSGHYIYFLSRKIGTGLSLFTCQAPIDRNFGYAIANPQLLYNQYGWLNQFLLIKSNFLKIKLNFTNGLIQIRLLDDSQRNYNGQLIIQQNFERNFYYFLSPGMDLSIKLFGPLHFTAGINYRFLFGKSHFSSHKEFEGTGINFGVTMMRWKV